MLAGESLPYAEEVEGLLEGEGGAALAATAHDAGIELDLAHVLAVERAASRSSGPR